VQHAAFDEILCGHVHVIKNVNYGSLAFIKTLCLVHEDT